MRAAVYVRVSTSRQVELRTIEQQLQVVQQIAEGDKVLTRWSSSATHRGELMGIAPTGNRTGVSGMTLSRISGGKLAEDWNNWDTLG